MPAQPRRAIPAFHPFFFFLFPILSLINRNLTEVRLGETYRSLVIGLLATLAILIVLTVILREYERAAVATSVLLILFFSYGHVYLWLKGADPGGLLLGRHRYLVPTFAVAYLLLVRLSLRKRGPLNRLTSSLNLIALIAIALPILGIGIGVFRFGQGALHGAVQVRDRNGRLPSLSSGAPPDIYYIILDAYARSDLLSETYGYENSEFEQFLSDQGFYVAQNSLANYAHTAFSLAAALNMSYVEDLRVDLDLGIYPQALGPRLIHSFVRLQLESLGYVTVGLDSGWQYSQLLDADYFLTPVSQTDGAAISSLSINPFEDLLLNSSGGRFAIDSLVRFSLLDPTAISWPESPRREIILSEFQALPDSASIPGPKFVYAHIISPHRPYLFGPDGEPRSPDGVFTFVDLDDSTPLEVERQKYIDQLIFVTKRIQQALETILSQSPTQPIIILQSDHGPGLGMNWENPTTDGLFQRMPILNAYLVPESCKDSLYPEISPINSFRVIFNCAFDADYELLPDHSYFSEFEDIDDFRPVEHLLH